MQHKASQIFNPRNPEIKDVSKRKKKGHGMESRTKIVGHKSYSLLRSTEVFW